MLPPPPPLNIIIIGAGIAGLAAAASLRRAGHTITIYERSSLNNEIGAAIHLCPNASRALIPWGLDGQRARFVTARCAFRAHGATAKVFHDDDMSGIEGRFGAPWFWCHRVDLHTELKRLACGEEGPGRPARVVLKSEVREYDPEAGSITLADGTTVCGDLVIAADGVHTRAAAAVLGAHNPATPTNHFAYRFLIPSSELAADPETAHFLEGDEGRMKFFIGEGKRIVCNEMQNFVCIFHDDERVFVEDWNTPVEKSALLDQYKEFHPSILAVFRKAKEIKKWPLLFRAPIPSWHKGKLVLIGDAAHPMLPHQGQGGAQAIEDGIALGIALSNLTSCEPDAIERRLGIFEKIRINRGSVMQIFSNAGQDDAARIRDEASKFIPVESVPKSPEDYFRFNFGYDVVKDGEQIMKKEFPDWKLPEAFVGKRVEEPELKKAVVPEVKKADTRVSVRSIVASFESIKV